MDRPQGIQEALDNIIDFRKDEGKVWKRTC